MARVDTKGVGANMASEWSRYKGGVDRRVGQIWRVGGVDIREGGVDRRVDGVHMRVG